MLPTPETSHVDVDRVYEPAEDSFVLLDALEQESQSLKNNYSQGGTVCLEIGSGSGIVSAFVAHILPNIIYLTTDINFHCCEATLETFDKNESSRKSFVDSINGPLADSLRIRPDIILFNPPYVPSSEDVDPSLQSQLPEDKNDSTWLDYALDGGKDGMQITNVLLDQLHEILSENGVAYILFCKRNHPEEVAKRMKQSYHWNVKLIFERKAGWEVLSVWEFRR